MLPYDGDRIINDPPLKNGRLRKGIIPANPALDPQSATKASWLRSLLNLAGSDQTPGDWFPGVTSMNYNSTLFDDSEPGLSAYLVDRSSGTSYPDGSSWKIPEDARGISESGNNTTGVAGDDAHCTILSWETRRILTVRQFHGLDFHGGKIGCYSGSGVPMDGEAAGWMVTPANWTLTGVGAPGSGSNGSPGTACGISMFDGLVTPEEFLYFLDTGQVLGGLRCTLPVARMSTGALFPAWKTDGQQTPSSETMKQGQLWYLAATPAQIASITDAQGSKTTRMAAWGRFIATKMTRGVRVEDKTTGGLGLQAVHRKSWELVEEDNKWAVVFQSTSIVTPTLALRQVRGFPQDVRVLAEDFVPDMSGGGGGPNQGPRASFTFSPTNPAVNETVTFTDTSYDPDGTITSREWALDNDGTFNDGGASPTTKSYPTAGVKNVRLRVYDNSGSSDSVGAQFEVSAAPSPNQPPIASFTVTPVSPQVGELVTFQSTATDPDGTIASRLWDFDDDNEFDASGATVTRTFPDAGTITVKHRVVDDDGASTDTEREIEIRPLAGPTPPRPPSAVRATLDGVTGNVTIEVDMPRDDFRDSTEIRYRTAPRSGDAPNASPASAILLNSSSPGAASGNPGEDGAYYALRPDVDEIKLVRVLVPAPGTYELWTFVGGGGSGGPGAANLRAIGFPLGAGNLPDGAPRAFLATSPLIVDYTDEMMWRLLARVPFAASGGYWVGAVIGGSSRSCRIARTLVEGNFPDGWGGDRYVDAAVSYASPPTTCPATGVGTSRASIYVLTQPGGGRLGGRLSVTHHPSEGDAYYTGYALNQAGASAPLDANNYPIEVGEPPDASEVQILGAGALSFTAHVVRTGEPTGPVVLIPEPTGRPEVKPKAWETENGVPVRRVEWDRDTNSWIYP